MLLLFSGAVLLKAARQMQKITLLFSSVSSVMSFPNGMETAIKEFETTECSNLL